VALINKKYKLLNFKSYRSRCRHGLGRRSAAARLLEWRVPIRPGAWMSAPCECCVFR